mgnify:CR=1 FL=1
MLLEYDVVHIHREQPREDERIGERSQQRANVDLQGGLLVGEPLLHDAYGHIGSGLDQHRREHGDCGDVGIHRIAVREEEDIRELSLPEDFHIENNRAWRVAVDCHVKEIECC